MGLRRICAEVRFLGLLPAGRPAAGEHRAADERHRLHRRPLLARRASVPAAPDPPRSCPPDPGSGCRHGRASCHPARAPVRATTARPRPSAGRGRARTPRAAGGSRASRSPSAPAPSGPARTPSGSTSGGRRRARCPRRRRPAHAVAAGLGDHPAVGRELQPHRALHGRRGGAVVDGQPAARRACRGRSTGTEPLAVSSPAPRRASPRPGAPRATSATTPPTTRNVRASLIGS